MEAVVLGSTEIKVNKNGFGALPIQRVSTEDAVKLARKAYEAGITFFDTARFYTDSEEKLILQRKQRQIMQTNSGSSWAFLCII